MGMQQDPTEDDTLRNEIQAAIAAGRELGPDMDRHLADSVLDRYRKEQTARQSAIVLQPTPKLPARSVDAETVGRTVLTLAAIAALVTIIIVKPEFWWVIFFLPAVAGARGWNRWKQH